MAKAREKRTYYVALLSQDDPNTMTFTTVGKGCGTAEEARRKATNATACAEGRKCAIIAQCGAAFTVEVKTTERRSIVPVGAEKTEGTSDE